MKTYLRKVRINNGGYDDSGTYWGLGMPLYQYTNDDMDSWEYMRALTRNMAIQLLECKMPNAEFWPGCNTAPKRKSL